MWRLGAITLAGALATVRLLPRETKFVRGKASLSLAPLVSHLRNPQLLATYAVGFNILFSLVGAFTYVNFYLADKPFSLGPAALGQIFTVYLIGACVTPVAGRLLDRIGYRMTLLGAVVIGAVGMLLTLVHVLFAIISGLALAATGVFVCQAAASSNVGKAASEARSSAAGLYVALYYFGGFAGSIIPGFFWDRAGWPACVAVILCVQTITAPHRLPALGKLAKPFPDQRRQVLGGIDDYFVFMQLLKIEIVCPVMEMHILAIDQPQKAAKFRGGFTQGPAETGEVESWKTSVHDSRASVRLIPSAIA